MNSRTIGARFAPLLSYMQRHRLIEWEQISEADVGVSHLHRFDVVLFNKHVSNLSLKIMRMANELGLHTIYDLDDWLLDLPSWSVLEMNEDVLYNVLAMIREASAATASNSLLQERMRKVRRSDDVLIIPNGFDDQAFDLSPELWTETQPPKIVFSNLDGIKLVSFRKEFFGTLRSFLARHENVSIDFWGDPFPELNTIARMTHRGSRGNLEYKKAIRDEGYTFAIVPLGAEEDPETLFFNSCKSPIKYADYGSLGIPSIYSDCPTYRENVKHRETGYIASNTAESWARALEDMLGDPQLRQSIRRNAYADVFDRFSVRRISSMFVKALPDPKP
ncbi:glycosyltransferase involved in cell wall biosynthesis [Paraburkholderia sp. CI2]|uniref:glycosyltransferase n=1 Tax=unclassified Paraburkholderia TaxID=2615204 RepID=UPI00178D9F81|nr:MULTISPECIES: glycosyltransferase [unclassified Paraburkholderia]MBB5465466.1 glycosyltransferase involved in cell wall biosynthesis [Paraburkholderia sp. CI2]